MTSCNSCGGSVDANETVCPYCSASLGKRVDMKPGDNSYRVTQDADGLSHVSFGDGVHGRKPSSGGGIQAGYRSGGGAAGNIASVLTLKLEALYHQIRKVPDPKKGGAKDAGGILIEALANMNDILSFYQEGISNEAYLETSERKSLSKTEKRAVPKLRELVRFCDKVNSRALGQLGLSDSDIQRIRTAAINTLRMAEHTVCSKCGAMNRPDNKRCHKCGRSL